VTFDAFENLPALALRLLDAYATAGIEAALGGGLAFNLWAIPRVTKDIDLNVFVSPDDYAKALAVLESAGARADQAGAEWDAVTRSEFLRRAAEGDVAVAWIQDVRIDVFVPSIPFYAEAQATLREVEFADGISRRVLSPEALAVFKLLFFRGKDLADLRRLVGVQGAALDAAWVRAQIVGMLGPEDDRVAAWDEILRDHA
jgi:hypothetical protein